MVFEFISQKIIDLSRTRMFKTDYELAMRNALKKKCPLSKLSACQFHFAQAVRTNGQKTDGFNDLLKSNDSARKIYYRLMYLPLLPVNEINLMFASLEEAANELNEPSIDRFIAYYKRQWIRKEGARKISVFGDEIRTTSPAEGYNRAINDYCQKKGSFIWFCASIRTQEFMKSAEFHAFVESGGLTGPKQSKHDKVSI